MCRGTKPNILRGLLGLTKSQTPVPSPVVVAARSLLPRRGTTGGTSATDWLPNLRIFLNRAVLVGMSLKKNFAITQDIFWSKKVDLIS
jgi:hypothetical protein